MTTGCLIFAYDGDIAYGPQAVLAACLVRKHLNIPVSLVTDSATLDKLEGHTVFDKIFVREVISNNTRILQNNTVAFKNTNRSSAYDITPYDRTLVIDSDFLVFSNRLSTYLEADRDFMICEGMNDVCQRGNQTPYLDPASIRMLWATNIIFNKTPEVKALFDLVEHIRENWIYYGALYKFDTRRFRNDYAFSVACHTLSGFGVNQFHTKLPSPLFFTDKDKLLQIKDGALTFLMSGEVLVRCQGQDVHFLDKYDLLDNYTELMELAND